MPNFLYSCIYLLFGKIKDASDFLGLSGGQKKYRCFLYNSFLTKSLILSLVMVITFGLAARGINLPIMPGLSASTERVKPRPRAIIKSPTKTCQGTLKKSGIPSLLAFSKPNQLHLTVISPVFLEHAVHRLCCSFPNRTDRAPPTLT